MFKVISIKNPNDVMDVYSVSNVNGATWFLTFDSKGRRGWHWVDSEEYTPISYQMNDMESKAVTNYIREVMK